MTSALAALLLLLAAPDAAATDSNSLWGTLDVGSRAAYGTGEFQRGFSANLAAGLTLYPWKRLVDDTNPIPYQPFLQSLSSVRAFAGLQYLSVDFNGLSSPQGFGTGGGVEVEYYATPAFTITARADAFNTSMNGRTGRHAATDQPLLDYLVVGLSVGLGYRTGNVLLDLRHRLEPTWADGSLTPMRWGHLTLRARTVFRIGLFVTAEGTVSDGGGGVAAGAEYFVANNKLGLFARFAFGHGRFDTLTAVAYDQLQLTPGVEYWLTRRIAVEADYRFEFNPTGIFEAYVHALRFGLDFRL